MKEEKYILNLIKEKLKNKKLINRGYAEVFYAVYKYAFNFSYADKEWINQDRMFTDNKEMLKAFSNILELDCKNYVDLPLTTVIGSCLGAKKINNYIVEENKKAKLLDYDNYLVCDYDKLYTGDYLNGTYYIKEKELNNLIVIAVKNNSEKSFNIINMYEECGFTVNEIKTCKIKHIIEALKSAKKSKTPVLIIVNNENVDRDLTVTAEYDLKNDIKTRTNMVYKKWLLEYDKEINERHENILSIINYLKDPCLSIDLENIQFNLDASYESTIAASSDKIFGIVKNKSKYITLVEIKDPRVSSLIALGLSISGLKPNVVIKNFISVSDIVALAVLNKFPVNFIMKNTNEAVYSQNLNIYIPSDMHEVIGSWSTIIKLDRPSLIILSNKETTLIKNTNLKYVKYGAYMIKKETDTLNGVIVSSGEDVKLALGVAGLLEKEGIILRVVTLPCANLLLKQAKYAKELLPSRVKIFVLDKNMNVINNKFASNNNCLISSDLGLDKVKEKIKDELNL